MAVNVEEFTADCNRSSNDEVVKALPEIVADLYAKITALTTRVQELEDAAV